jgi:glycogen phosphorylase
MDDDRRIAYFSMEIALEGGMPTFSGGLGVLAGDTVRSAADLRVPMVAITLLYRKGYFTQRLGESGWQREEPAEWAIDDYLEPVPAKTFVLLEGRTVHLRAWRYQVPGTGGYTVPVYFLDTDLSENTTWDRTLTAVLYGGDPRYRLCQEVVLGIGGIRMLRALGYDKIERYHMNEGHASLLTLALLMDEAKKAGRRTIGREDIDAVRAKCVFTTHTPVSAGHDEFPLDLVSGMLPYREGLFDLEDAVTADVIRRVLRQADYVKELESVFRPEHSLNMTYLALNLSRYINGVAKRHGEVSRMMFAGYDIDSITNGVHAATWMSEPFQQLCDRYIPGWRQDNFSLRYALNFPRAEVWEAHLEAKRQLIGHVNRVTNAGMDVDILTLGFARRATAYKRADLLLQDLDRLKRIAAHIGGVQVVYAGKAHPHDHSGKELIQRIFQARDLLHAEIKLAYLENYDLDLAKLMTSGADVWLNTPQRPLEASGTSGMKAALNGVPSLSILDGWWIEGHIEGITGWAIGEDGSGPTEGNDRSKDAASLYAKLEQVIVPTFYHDRDRFIDVMLHCIAINGSFFNTQRMVQQYVVKAYL